MIVPIDACRAKDVERGTWVFFEGQPRKVVAVDRRGKDQPYFRFAHHSGSMMGNWYSYRLCFFVVSVQEC